MNVTQTPLSGVLLLKTRIFSDGRGSFRESWSARRYHEAGLPLTFVQDNVSRSRRGVLRGLHFQHPHGQGKLVSVLRGEVFDVAVDLRRGSPTFGEWYGCTLSADNGRQLYIPEGFAHGFQVTSEEAIFAYKCTEYYAPDSERTLLWNDSDLAITWPVPDPTVSDKDARGTSLADLRSSDLPEFPLNGRAGRPVQSGVL